MAQNLVFDQLILEYPQVDDGRAGWVHVSCKGVGKPRSVPDAAAKRVYGGLPKLKRVHEKFPNAENVTKSNKLLFEVTWWFCRTGS